MNAAPVAVVGGGPAGCHFAIGLARAGVRVTLFERAATAPRWRAGEWLAPEGKTELVRADLWRRLPQSIVSACEVSRVAWDEATPVARSFLTNPHGCAWLLDRPRFDACLLEEARRAGVRVTEGARVCRIERRAGGFILDVEHSDVHHLVETSFVVDASGRSASIAHMLLRGSKRWDHLCAVVATTDAHAPTEDGFSIEAVPSGWWYSAPLPNRTRIASYFTDADLVPKRIRSDQRAIDALLEAAPLTRAHAPGLKVLGIVSAATRSSEHIAQDGWLAIGDAALAQDPLCGEGITAALRTSTAAQRAFFAWSSGDVSALARYDHAGAILRDRSLRARSDAYRNHARFGDLPFWTRRSRSSAGFSGPELEHLLYAGDEFAGARG